MVVKVPKIVKIEYEEEEKDQVQPALPIKGELSMLTSRFDLENEIERQFGQVPTADFNLNITKKDAPTADIEMKNEENQPKAVQGARYAELKKKFDGASKNQYKFTPTFS